MPTPRIYQARTEAEIAIVRGLFSEYLEMLGTDYANAVGCAKGREDLHDFPNAYLALFLGMLDDKAYAVCGLKHINKTDVELGKLYCKPSGRGHGFGHKLTRATVEHAKALGCARLVLSTEPIMKHAIALYTNMGFRPIENYQCGVSGCSRFMGLEL